MKKFLNVLFALSALGLIVACKPAGNGKTRLRKRPDPVKPDDPEKPIWDDDPEEILTQKDFAWFGTANGAAVDSVPYDFGFMGFCKKDGQLYVYYNDSKDQAYYPKNAKAIWKNTLQRGVMNVGANRTRGWHKVIWNDNNQYTYKFTIPTINKAYEFKLDTTDKALKAYREGKRETDFYKWYLNLEISQLTPQMKTLMSKKASGDSKAWKTESASAGAKYEWHYVYCTFVYDEDTQRLYHYGCKTEKQAKTAQQERNFSKDKDWQLVYPNPYGNPNVFYTMAPGWNIKYIIESDNKTLTFASYQYCEDGRYYCSKEYKPDIYRGTIRKDTINQSNMGKMS